MFIKLRSISLLVLSAMVLGFAAPAEANGSPTWPTVGGSPRENCTVTWKDGSEPFRFQGLFTEPWLFHHFQDGTGNIKATGTHQSWTQNGEPLGSGRSVLVYKPGEIDQPAVGSIFEWTDPHRNVQCKSLHVQRIQYWGFCREFYVLSKCEGNPTFDNVRSQVCSRPVPCQ